MKTTKLLFTVFAFTVAAAFVSCKKNSKEETPADTDVQGAQDNALAENTSNDAVSMGGQLTDANTISHRPGEGNQSETVYGCADSIFYDAITKVGYVHFNGSVCADGKTRSGILNFDCSGSTSSAKYYRDPGFKMHITSQNYVVDGNQVTIDKTVTNTTAVGFNPATTPATWHITSTI